ncbi:hypothetical protein HY493_03015 [Candidatus Woesearchaeota archaeon]|nr:hypothetical protein [Candidatus Woesearchaeota archaeon]
MVTKHALAAFLAFVLASSLVLGATVHGTIYNLDLNPVKNARVEIDTQPRQVLIAPDGTYEFTVPKGTYTLTARLIQNKTITAIASEEMTVPSEGTFVLDLIMFPVFEEEDILNLTDEIDPDEAQLANGDLTQTYLLGGIGILVILGLSWYLWHRKKKTHHAKATGPEQESAGETPIEEHHAETHLEEPHAHGPKEKPEELPQTERDDAKTVLDIIRQLGGRTTQKEIRKLTPLSEAKVSLIITELEHKGQIEKIKKGRGNVIVLK